MAAKSTHPSPKKLTLPNISLKKGSGSMIFLGKLIAVVLVGFGIFSIGVGFLIAAGTPTMIENAQLSARYLATENSGDGIDRGVVMVGVGVVFGLLARIAKR
jgi:hypothetical protein